jgi:GDP-L-fucose synthase
MSMRKDARIFVAGKTGLIGSAMVRLLEREGFSQIVAPSRDDLDLQDAVAVAGFFDRAKPQYVVLAAGRVGGIVENQTFPADFMDENIAIQLNVLMAARKANVAKLILFGSSCMYPRECPQPMAEDSLLSARPEPTSLPYAISKLAGTYMCLAYNKQHGDKRFIPVIPNSAYGPNDNFDSKSGHVLSSLMARFHAAKIAGLDFVTLWGSGSPRREFVHADDIAAACLHLLQNEVSSLEFPLNIGVGSDVSIRQLAEMIASIVGYHGRLEWDASKPDGAPRKLLDSSRLKSYGWKPSVQLHEGLRSTYEWYRLNNVETTVQPA